jgi:hypothetical protein
MEMRHAEVIKPGLVDSRLKFHVLLLFIQHPGLCSGMWRLHEWLRESPWAIEETLEALADGGFLARVDGGERRYRLALCAERQILLEQLVIQYDDPLRRDAIYALVRMAEQEQLFQMSLASCSPAGGGFRTATAASRSARLEQRWRDGGAVFAP